MTEALFLDFDGVICDSVDECFVSSWLAYYHRYRGERPASIDLDYYRQFRAYRPFIRSGEDYLLVHVLIHDHIPVSNQAEFDHAVERAGWEEMATFRSLIYAVREEFVNDDLGMWLGLHRPYPGLVPSLTDMCGDQLVWIISTKEPKYIAQILTGWGVAWPEDRILLPVSATKPQVIRATMASHCVTDAVFVDDQRDHLRCEGIAGLTCRLAVWGHITPAWLDDPEIDPIELDQFIGLLTNR